MLEFVTAVVSQFGERYRSAITGYGFTVGQFNETEYPIVRSTYFCDTSSEAAQAFRIWLASRYATPAAAPHPTRTTALPAPGTRGAGL